MTLKLSSLKNHNLRVGWFLVAGLAMVVAVGLLQTAPGYMDADYYYAGGIQLASGKGFTQPFLWNYLDDPLGLPAPANTFWMPLVSILSAAGYALFHTFTGGRIILWLLAATIPALTHWIGVRQHGDVKLAALGGIFSIISGYYLVYMPTTDSFGVTMLLGSLFLLLGSQISQGSDTAPLWLGGVAGLLHMTRADGILWLAGGVAWIFWVWMRSGGRQERLWGRLFVAWGLCLAGYLVVASPWYVRNWLEFGSLFPPGGSRTLWLTQYEDLFLYPSSQLTFARWLGAGWAQIASGWGRALWSNLQTAVAVQGSIILTPFIVIGLYKNRKRAEVLLGTFMWLVTLAVFSLVFPYQGVNGSFFHSGAAFQPLFWAAAPLGIAQAVQTVAELRKWQRGAQVQRFLSILLVVVCLLLSVGLAAQKLMGIAGSPAWNAGSAPYARVDRALVDLGATPCELVMVNNPPGYYLASGRSAVVIPYGDEITLRNVAEKFAVRFLVIDQNNAGYLSRLYLEPASYPGFRFLTQQGDFRIYEFER